MSWRTPERILDRWWREEDWAWVKEERVMHPAFWERDSAGWHWLAMFERVPLPPDWPVYVTWAEAHAYARWRGRRLMTEAEFHRAAFATPAGRDRRYPWGETLDRAAERGNLTSPASIRCRSVPFRAARAHSVSGPRRQRME
jgi:formylglycine-generating enzyme required for sulfatase activity